MFDWADRRRCRHRTLVGYFGESIDDCGESCDVCTGTDVLAGLAVPSKGRMPAVEPIRATPADDAAFDALRELRRRLAAAAGVPAYVVFSDATLREMAARRPTTAAELFDVGGVGPTKLERYGEAFLEVLRSLHDDG
jgi:ATP-dependent DNA helicase RecQ